MNYSFKKENNLEATKLPIITSQLPYGPGNTVNMTTTKQPLYIKAIKDNTDINQGDNKKISKSVEKNELWKALEKPSTPPSKNDLEEVYIPVKLELPMLEPEINPVIFHKTPSTPYFDLDSMIRKINMLAQTSTTTTTASTTPVLSKQYDPVLITKPQLIKQTSSENNPDQILTETLIIGPMSTEGTEPPIIGPLLTTGQVTAYAEQKTKAKYRDFETKTSIGDMIRQFEETASQEANLAKEFPWSDKPHDYQQFPLWSTQHPSTVDQREFEQAKPDDEEPLSDKMQNYDLVEIKPVHTIPEIGLGLTTKGRLTIGTLKFPTFKPTVQFLTLPTLSKKPRSTPKMPMWLSNLISSITLPKTTPKMTETTTQMIFPQITKESNNYQAHLNKKDEKTETTIVYPATQPVNASDKHEQITSTVIHHSGGREGNHAGYNAGYNSGQSLNGVGNNNGQGGVIIGANSGNGRRPPKRPIGRPIVIKPLASYTGNKPARLDLEENIDNEQT